MFAFFFAILRQDVITIICRLADKFTALSGCSCGYLYARAKLFPLYRCLRAPSLLRRIKNIKLKKINENITKGSLTVRITLAGHYDRKVFMIIYIYIYIHGFVYNTMSGVFKPHLYFWRPDYKNCEIHKFGRPLTFRLDCFIIFYIYINKHNTTYIHYARYVTVYCAVIVYLCMMKPKNTFSVTFNKHKSRESQNSFKGKIITCGRYLYNKYRFAELLYNEILIFYFLRAYIVKQTTMVSV